MESIPNQRGEPGGNRGGAGDTGIGDSGAAPIFHHNSFREVCGQLALSQLSGREGAFLLIGQRRVGKSTLIGVSLRNAQSFGKTVFLTCDPRMSGADLLKALSEKIGAFRGAPDRFDEPLGESGLSAPEWAALEEALVEAGRITIVLDSAEQAPDAVLEIAHRLSMARGDRDRHLGLVLVGRPELSGRLNSPDLLALKGDVAFRAILEPISEGEVPAFVAAWLQTLYPQGAPVFSDEALARIARASLGVPETLARLCRDAVDIARGVPCDEIDLAIVTRAVAGLELEASGRRPGGDSPGDETLLRPGPGARVGSGLAPTGIEDLDPADLESDQDWPALPEFELEDCEVEASNPTPQSVPLAAPQTAPPNERLAEAPTVPVDRLPLSEPQGRTSTFRGFTVGLVLGLVAIIGMAIGAWVIAGSDRAQELLAALGLPAADTSGHVQRVAEPAGSLAEAPKPETSELPAGAKESLAMIPAMVDAPNQTPVGESVGEPVGEPVGAAASSQETLARSPGVPEAKSNETAKIDPRSEESGTPGALPESGEAGPVDQTGAEPLGPAETIEAAEPPETVTPESARSLAGDEALEQPTQAAAGLGSVPELETAGDPPQAPAPGSLAQIARQPSPDRKLDQTDQVEPAPERSVAAAKPDLQPAGSDSTAGPAVVEAGADPAAAARDDQNAFERSLSELKRRDIQRALTVLKLGPGPADGAIGSRTRAAIKAFQSSQGVAATGNLEPQLVGLLFGRAEAETARLASAARRNQRARLSQTRSSTPPERNGAAAGAARSSTSPSRVRYPDESEMEWLGRLAAGGDRVAQTSLGQRYYHGNGVTRDHKAAAKWYQLAAKQGDATAQTNLGRLYFNGEGVPLDKRKSAEWSLAAALQGNRTAQFNLGLMYKHGSGVTQDLKKASHWLRKAAEKGVPGARAELDQVIAEQNAPAE